MTSHLVASSIPVSAIEGFLGSLVLAVFLAVADELFDSSDEGDHFLFVKIKVKSDSTKDHNSTKEF